MFTMSMKEMKEEEERQKRNTFSFVLQRCNSLIGSSNQILSFLEGVQDQEQE